MHEGIQHNEASQSLAASMSAAAPHDVPSFVGVMHDWLVSKGQQYRQLIDTPEERAAVEGVAAYDFDRFVAPGINKVSSKLTPYVKIGVMASFDAILTIVGGEASK